MSTLFEDGYFGPKFIKKTDTVFDEEDKKTLNKLHLRTYLFFAFSGMLVLAGLILT